MTRLSLQERFAPQGSCFGCGPANDQGLRIRSFPDSEEPEALVCEWTPRAHFAAFATFLYGGVICSLFDCHSNWTATWHLMRRDALETPPCTVTADFHVEFRRPTPMDEPVRIKARVTASRGNRVETEATLSSHRALTATSRGTFVAVEPDHPAYHRW